MASDMMTRWQDRFILEEFWGNNINSWNSPSSIPVRSAITLDALGILDSRISGTIVSSISYAQTVNYHGSF